MRILRLFLIFYLLNFVGLEVFAEGKDYAQYVNPFIGTQGDGHCFPGATRPLGMVQSSPETTVDHYVGYEGDHIAGYQYSDPYIWGFTQTHLNGVGCPTLSDILLLPFCGDCANRKYRTDFRSIYRKETEVASPGYYSVELITHKVKVELTALKHIAYHRYTYDQKEKAHLLIDLQYGVSWNVNNIKDNILEAQQQFSDAYTLCGYRKAREWTQRKLFYVIKWNKPVTEVVKLDAPGGDVEKAPRYVLSFDMEGDNTLEVCVALSTVSIENALMNLNEEFNGFGSFEQECNRARCEWNDLFRLIEIEGTEDQKRNFYTAFYRLYTQPNNIADVNGEFRAENDSIYKSPDNNFYSTLSTWDTYRAVNPLYTILTPSLSESLQTSMMLSYKYKKINPKQASESNSYFPRWGLWGREVHTMIANHAVPIIVDAWLKGIKSPYFTNMEIFNALWTTVTKEHHGNHVKLIDYYGYIPYDDKMSPIDNGRETVSRLLEGIYDDYCVALMADSLGLRSKYDFLMKRAGYYRNVYDPSSGFMRGKNRQGFFKKDVDINEIVGEWIPESDFTEANAFHYRFHVQHDVPGLIALNGGGKSLARRLDSMFFAKTNPIVKGKSWKITGCLGQYWHGNEPCHHLAYLYKYTNEGEKTDLLIRYLTSTLYKNKENGLPGSDDCGQMSAWYMLSCLGFYPVNPCGGEYVLGAPQFKKAKIQLPNGKVLKIEAERCSEKNYAVDAIYFNGNKKNDIYITHSELLQGGKLKFRMKKGKIEIKDSLFKRL